MIKKCILCNKIYQTCHSPQRFCSYKCSAIFREQKRPKKSILKKCLRCGKEMIVTPSDIKVGKGKYCSRKCSDISRITRINGFCKTCNKPIIIHKYRIFHKEGNFCSIKCKSIVHSKFMKENHNSLYKGGKRIDSRGYMMIYNSDKKKYEFEHRMIMEKILNRKLTNNEYVHHKNSIKNDNRPENLTIVIRKTHFGNVRCPHCLKEFLIK